MSRAENWHEWWYDRSLDPLREQIVQEEWRQPLIRILEAVAFQRSQIAWSRDVAKEPANFDFRIGSRTYKFCIPKRRPNESEKRHQEAVLALKALTSFKGSGIREKDGRTLAIAAVTWIARHYIQSPTSWSGKIPTRAEIAKHFKVSERRLRSATQHLASDPTVGYTPIEDILHDKPGRRPIVSPRIGAATLLNSEAARSPEGQRAMRMIEEAYQLEHGWRFSPDLKAAPPQPGEVRKACQLRQKGMDILRRLYSDTSESDS